MGGECLKGGGDTQFNTCPDGFRRDSTFLACPGSISRGYANPEPFRFHNIAYPLYPNKYTKYPMYPQSSKVPPTRPIVRLPTRTAKAKAAQTIIIIQ